MSIPSNCHIYIDTDNTFFIYSTDSSVITFDFYDGDMSTNSGWHDAGGFTNTPGSGTWGNGYVSWSCRSQWKNCSNYTSLATLQGRARNDYSGSWAYSETKNNPLYVSSTTPGSPTYLRTDMTSTSATIYFTKGTNADYTEIYDNQSGVAPTSSTTTSTTTYNNYVNMVLPYGTRTYFWLRSVNSYGKSSWVSAGSAYIPYPIPDPPEYAYKEYINNTVKLWFYLGQAAQTTELYYNTTNVTPTSGTACTVSTSNFNNISVTIPYNATCYIWLRSRNSTGTSSWVYADSAYASSPVPLPFSWSFTISSGGQIYSYTQSGNTVTAKILPATDWNTLTARINQWRAYKGLASATFTTVSSNGSFTASIVDEVINALNPMLTTTIGTISSGNSISANLLNTIVSRMNAIT